MNYNLENYSISKPTSKPVFRENYHYQRNQPFVTGVMPLSNKIENYEYDYPYANFQPARPPTKREENAWTGVL